jgi:hypothetical protein
VVQFLYLLAAGLMNEVRFLTEPEIILFVTVAVEPTQPPIQWVPFSRSPGVKPLRREAGHSPLFAAWMYRSTHSYVFMALGLVEHNDNFTLTLRSIVLAREGSRAKFID